jgi:hypothetical protein
MTVTKTKPNPLTTVSTDEYAWFTCKTGKYRVEKTRFGLYKSIDMEGNDLITALTEEGVHACTPLHLLAHQPDYDGRYDHVMGKSTPHVDL